MGKRTQHKGSSRRVTRTVLVPVAGPSSSDIKLAERRKYTRTKLAEQTAQNEERIRTLFNGELSVLHDALDSYVLGIDPETVALVREQALRNKNVTAIQPVEDSQDVGMEWVDEAVPVEDEFIRAMKDVQQLPCVNEVSRYFHFSLTYTDERMVLKRSLVPGNSARRVK